MTRHIKQAMWAALFGVLGICVGMAAHELTAWAFGDVGDPMFSAGFWCAFFIFEVGAGKATNRAER